MKVAVLGSGNGGLSCAFELAQKGREVRLFDFDSFGEQIDAVAREGGIWANGKIAGFAPVAYSGHDIEQALDGVDLVMAVGPAFATPAQGEACRGLLKAGMAVIVCPSSCAGSLTFIQSAGIASDDGVIVGETSTLPYAVRISGPAAVNVYHRLTGGLYLAAVPREDTDKLLEMVADVWPLQRADSIFQTTLQNGNPVIHPAVSLLNAGAIDRGGEFLFYEEGVTEGVGKLIEAVDAERLAIAESLGVHILSEPALGVTQEYMLEDNYSTGYSKAPGFLGIGAQNKLDHRYLTEDVGFGLVFLTDLARRLGIETPIMDSVIDITSVILSRDLRAEQARTLTSLGFGELSAEELRAL